jgi:RNA polymerase sigma-70 factor (ECF subfamily)
MNPPSPASDNPPRFSPDEETALVVAAQREKAAFAPLYRLYVRPVYRYLYSRTGQSQDAEDLTAQVFTDAMESLPRYRNDGAFAAWLFTIARRRAVDHLRRRKPDAVLSEQIPSDDAGGDPQAEACRREESRRLRKMIALLNDADRELLRLRFAADLRLAEIARVLGRGEGAVKMSLRRLLQRLESEWEKNDA